MKIEFIDGLNFVKRMPGKVSFMYSPQPFSVHGDYTSVTVTVTNQDTGASHAETRALYNSVAHFDLSRIFQLLSPDVDEALTKTSILVPFEVTLSDANGYLLTCQYTAVYGAMDQLESYFAAPQSLRVWLNYPQTMQAWRNTEGRTGLKLSTGFIAFDNPDNQDLVEAPIMESLSTRAGAATETAQLRAKLESGQRVSLERSAQFALDANGWRGIDWAPVVLIPDAAPRDTGTYLRWLHRDGSRGYWHFENGTLSTVSAEHAKFRRYLEGNPSEVVSGGLNNDHKLDYAEAQQLTIGTTCNTMNEYEYLCGLATSPVVERLVVVGDEDIWQRVNVLPGTLARNRRHDTPHVQTIEMTIELPERNTIKL